MGVTHSINARACCDVGNNPYPSNDIRPAEFRRPPQSNKKASKSTSELHKLQHRGIFNDLIDIQRDPDASSTCDTDVVNEDAVKQLEEMKAIVSDLVKKNQTLESKCRELASQNTTMKNVADEFLSGQRELDIISEHYADLAKNNTSSGSRDNLDLDVFERIYTGDQEGIVHAGEIVPSPSPDRVFEPSPRYFHHRRSASPQVAQNSTKNFLLRLFK